MEAREVQKIKSCCFFGHRQIYQEEKPLYSKVFQEVEKLILDGFEHFYFGGYGDFDHLCHKVVCDLKEKYPKIKSIYVFAYYSPQKTDFDDYFLARYDETFYPDIEEVPKRYAIYHRNRRIIDISDFCIIYSMFEFGGAYDALKYARRKKKPYKKIGNKL